LSLLLFLSEINLITVLKSVIPAQIAACLWGN
jgi:hypothetical protein